MPGKISQQTGHTAAGWDASESNDRELRAIRHVLFDTTAATCIPVSGIGGGLAPANRRCLAELSQGQVGCRRAACDARG